MEQKDKEDKLKQQLSPTSPQFQLDENPLQQNMDRNKESLKRKLMLRRSVNELVNQGIMPPLKTPPAFAEQRKQLERAKTGDLLRHKIQSRPDRQALVQQHILEDTNPHVDPSLQDRQRLLKRAKLVDDLNEKLAHRPGPLELVADNILQSEKNLQRAITDGNIHYTKTCEGEDVHSLSRPHFVFDVESPKSDGNSSPEPSDSESARFGQNIMSPTSLASLSSLPPTGSNMFTFPGNVPITTQSFVPQTSSGHSVSVTSPNSSKSGTMSSSNGGKGSSGRIKKSKPKSQAKNKVIKFHEYKGPPNSKNQQTTNPAPTPIPPPGAGAGEGGEEVGDSETPYHHMLQQQQLFLQWQLEFQQNNMQFTRQQSKPSQMSPQQSGAPVMSPPMVQIKTEPGSQLSPSCCSTSTSSTAVTTTATASTSATSSNNVNTTSKSLSKLEDMKVAVLKAELKKRNLPVSGPKPQLIERLRPYSDVITSTAPNSLNTNENTVVSLPGAPAVTPMVIAGPPSVAPPSVAPASVSSVDEASNMSMQGSPPMSPQSRAENVVTVTTPLSPDSMDTSIMFPTNYVTHLNLSSHNKSQPSIPMAVDQISRPPSVAPMDTDSSLSATATTNSVPPQLEMVGQPPTAVNLNTAQISHDELLRRQQQQIEELQRQLHMSLQQQQLLAAQAAAVQAAKLTAKSQGIPSIVVTAQPQVVPPTLSPSGQQKMSNKILHENLNVGQPKVAFSKPPPNGQPFIFSSKPGSGSKPTVAVMPLNGVVHNRSSSVPSSPVDSANKTGLKRSITNPFFGNVHMKEPPKYDDAMKNRQTASTSGDGSSGIKSQAMDDLLEVLIRSGELPASAAQEPPPTPKTTAISSVASSGINVMTTPSGLATVTSAISFNQPQLNAATVSIAPVYINSQHSPKRNILSPVKKDPPPPLNLSPISNIPADINVNELPPDFTDLNEFSLMDMDWTVTGGDIDLPDGLNLDTNSNGQQQQLLEVPTSNSSSVSQRGSEPNLAALGINDSDVNNSGMNLDVSDWLDVILPNGSGLTPLSANAPMSFASDPLLTPKPQDVLDLFNMDESDFNTPTDVASGMNWDKLIENTGPSTSGR